MVVLSEVSAPGNLRICSLVSPFCRLLSSLEFGRNNKTGRIILSILCERHPHGQRAKHKTLSKHLKAESRHHHLSQEWLPVWLSRPPVYCPASAAPPPPLSPRPGPPPCASFIANPAAPALEGQRKKARCRAEEDLSSAPPLAPVAEKEAAVAEAAKLASPPIGPKRGAKVKILRKESCWSNGTGYCSGRAVSGRSAVVQKAHALKSPCTMSPVNIKKLGIMK
ncbi:hypothetical protein KSP40_PGU015977 [Platanthera guangdongensis]|uniref:Uncharacterized protein n=1 Tax=Platanthera guangdongensis TaxID=2320717 RepID=A0ABR2MYJ3_9ASPA